MLTSTSNDARASSSSSSSSSSRGTRRAVPTKLAHQKYELNYNAKAHPRNRYGRGREADFEALAERHSVCLSRCAADVLRCALFPQFLNNTSNRCLNKPELMTRHNNRILQTARLLMLEVSDASTGR
jgi:hypothetical protein